MKTISKILSVILCLSLVIGLFVFGSSAATTNTYTKVTSVSDITAGTYVIGGLAGTAIDDGSTFAYMSNVDDGKQRLVGTKLTESNGVVTTDDTSVVWNLVATDGGFYLQSAADSKYVQLPALKKATMVANASEATVFTVIEYNGGITLKSSGTIVGHMTANRFGSAGSYYLGFAAYASSSSSCPCNLTFYKLSEGGSVTPPASSEGTSTEATTEATTPSTEAPVPQLPPVTAPVAGTAYKFGMEQVANGHTVYIAGGVSNSRFLVTTTDKDAALDVTVEASGNGFKFAVTIDGAKQYITASLNSSNQGVLGYGAEGAVFTFNDTIKSWVVDLNGTSYYIGSYSNFDTMSLSKASYMTAENTGISQYPAGFYPSSSEPSQEPTPDASTEATTPSTEATTPAAPSTGLTVVGKPVAGTAYKFGMIQQNVSTSTVYYLAGGMDGYYMATTTDEAAAIDVYLEETTGGYYMYTMVDGVKTYINMVVSGTHVNGAYEATASTVYRYDETAKTLIAVVNDADYWFGTRNDREFTTVGPCATSYNGFYCQFYAEASAPSPTGDNSVISLAVAAAVLSILGGTALVMKKKEN